MKAAVSTRGIPKLLSALYFSGFKMGEKEIKQRYVVSKVLNGE